jgi:hypothetical protein
MSATDDGLREPHLQQRAAGEVDAVVEAAAGPDRDEAEADDHPRHDEHRTQSLTKVDARDSAR